MYANKKPIYWNILFISVSLLLIFVVCETIKLIVAEIQALIYGSEMFLKLSSENLIIFSACFSFKKS